MKGKLAALVMSGVIIVLAVSVGTAQARSTRGTLRTSAKWYSGYMVVRSMFHVYDDGLCIRDEYGLYDNLACDNYDSNDADLDIRVWRHTVRGWRIVHSERMSGYSGVASVTLDYSSDLGFPYFCSGPIRRNYRYSVRLFDPVSDRTIAQRTVPFYVFCR
jgi:hypothetical protein